MRKFKSGASRTAPPPQRPRPTVGASQRRSRLADIASAWGGHHRASACSSLERLLATPVQTLMTALVVAIALALPATLLTGLNNLQQVGESWEASPKVSVYLQQNASAGAVADLRHRLAALPQVDTVTFVSPEEAAQELQAMSGLGEALEALDNNPLPPSFVLTPTADVREPSALRQLAGAVEQEALVDEVGLDMDWVRRLRELMVLGKRIVFALAALLALGVLIAVGNTIRLAIENRRDEIVVAKLVGGTDGFVRRPFLYSGSWYGLMGGVIACVLVTVGYWSISGPVARLAAAYQSDFRLDGLGLSGALVLLLVSTGLGWVGAWLAVSRHLSQIEPK